MTGLSGRYPRHVDVLRTPAAPGDQVAPVDRTPVGTSADRRRLWSRRVYLTVEYVVLFFGVTGLYWWVGRGTSPIPLLIVLAGLSVWYLRRRGFTRARFGLNGTGFRDHRAMLLVALAAFVVGSAVVWWWRPDLLYGLPRHEPVLWLFITVFYPLVSVYPQELVYRGVMFERYAPVFGSGTPMVAASATAFGFVHIIFGSWVSVLLTLVGGWMFARRYQRRGSLMSAAVEHAVYGVLVFTIGLGQFFYHGAGGG